MTTAARPSPGLMPKERAATPAVARPLAWRLTPHARSRAAEFGFTVEEVVACANEPTLAYDSDATRYGRDERVHKRGRVACIVRPSKKTVVTVLLPKIDKWEHGL